MMDKSEIPTCWLALDIMDREPQRFLSYFIACIQEKFPAFGTESANMLMNAVSIEKENERLVVALTNEIYQAVHEHFAIVLDDYQFVDQVPEIRLFINRFIQLAGEHCHLILASRLLPTLPDLHLLVARDQTGGLSMEHLTFSPEEIRALFAQNSSQNISIGQAEDIARKTDGWITSITLTGLSFVEGSLTQKPPTARTGIELYDYFTREVLAHQQKDLREFLLLTSLFDDVSISLCTAVLETLVKDWQLNWKDLFNTVQNNNLFAIPVGNDGLNFRYHHLFQEFLQTKLQEENPEIIPEVMLHLASFYREHQDWEKAHHIYENIGAQPELIALIEEAGSSFILNGRIVTLGNWLERLPTQVIQQNPKLLSLHGAVAYTQGDTQMGVSLLSQAELGFRAKQDLENLALTLVRRASAYRELGDLNRALADADETIAITSSISTTTAQYNCAMAQRVRGMTLFRLGRTLEAVPMLENALRMAESFQNHNQIPIYEMELGAVHYTLGNIPTAIKYYQSALKTWQATGNLGWQATLLNNLAVMHHYRGEYEKAFHMLEDAIQCAQKSGYVRAQALALSSLGDLLADLDELVRAEECFDQSLIVASQMGYSFLIFYTSIAKARIARLGSRLTVADTLLQGLLANVQQNASPAEEALFRMELGCLMLYNNKPLAAVDELSRAINLYEQDGRVLEVCISRLWLAAARLACGETDPQALQLSAILAAYRTLKEPAPLQAAAGEVQQWLEKLAIPHSLFAHLQPLFTRAEEFKNKIPVIRRNIRRISKSAFISPPHISITSFGPVQVSINRKRITPAEWQTRETRELFFFFLRSKPMTKEEVAAIFWPDISPERLKMRFKTSLYRLRHAVGQYTILFENDHYRFNHNIDYEFDLETYNGLVEKSRTTKNSAESAALLQSAVDLVRGSYLADIDTAWSDSERTQFETDHLAILLHLAGLYLEIGQPSHTLRICQAALKNSRLSEEAYRLMMRAYIQLGDTASAADVYKKCSKLLKTDLGIRPAVETEKLYHQLI